MIVDIPVEGSVVKYEVIMTKCLDSLDDRCNCKDYDRVLKRGEVRDYYIVFKKKCEGDVDIDNVKIELMTAAENDYGAIILAYSGGLAAVPNYVDTYYVKVKVDTGNFLKDVYKILISMQVSDYNFIYDGFLLIKDDQSYIAGFNLLH